MTKKSKKLSLNRETVRILNAAQMRNANGGTLHPTQIGCPVETFACPADTTLQGSFADCTTLGTNGSWWTCRRCG